MPHHEQRRTGLVLAGTAFGILSLGLTGCTGTGRPATTVAPPPTTTTTAPSTLSAPQTRQPHIMEFTATGTAKVSSAKYVIDGQATTVPVTTLPWNQTVNIPADGAKHNYELDIDYGGGNIEMLAIVDGQTQDSSSGSASGSGNTGNTAQLSGDFVG
ncbi:MAG TPA: hypothetical protein VGM75_25140 [Pseudonocardiaceae bacterium]